MRVAAFTDRSSVGSDWGVALVVAAVQVVGGTFTNMRQTGVHSLDALGYLLLLAGPVALIWRRAQPVPVLFVVLAACLAYSLRGYGYGPIFVSLVVAFLTAASNGSRWWTYPLVPLGYLALVWPVPALLGRPADLWQIFALMAWPAVLVSVAEGIRQRKALLVARRQRAEATLRDEEAQRERRASEERLAIARELHDVLAHSLSMINVQSSVALELLDKRPEQAETALTAIKAASRDALTEVHALLQTIRSGAVVASGDHPADDAAPTDDTSGHRRTLGSRKGRDSAADERASGDSRSSARAKTDTTEPPPAPRAPTPSIGDLDELLQRPRVTGLTIETRVLGTPQQLPSVIDAAAVRIIQESLTNVLRHAPGADATVTVRYAADSVDITVDNTRPTSAPSRPGSSGGNGIIGMRERAHALGGALTAGPRPSGGFRVAARLPARTPESGATQPDTASPGPTPIGTAASTPVRSNVATTGQEAAGPSTATPGTTPPGIRPIGTAPSKASSGTPGHGNAATTGQESAEPSTATPGTTPPGIRPIGTAPSKAARSNVATTGHEAAEPSTATPGTTPPGTSASGTAPSNASSGTPVHGNAATSPSAQGATESDTAPSTDVQNKTATSPRKAAPSTAASGMPGTTMGPSGGSPDEPTERPSTSAGRVQR
ncbi:sensor histidine kinase [Nocardia amamiensis]|uniref:sensor histidine kinase n=1 Tax=Nocardia amamiensis TaxID=404578 RepID=UPI0008315166|nr:histidine kinase [Nocardia amamiensis]